MTPPGTIYTGPSLSELDNAIHQNNSLLLLLMLIVEQGDRWSVDVRAGFFQLQTSSSERLTAAWEELRSQLIKLHLEPAPKR